MEYNYTTPILKPNKYKQVYSDNLSIKLYYSVFKLFNKLTIHYKIITSVLTKPNLKVERGNSTAGFRQTVSVFFVT